VEGKMRREKALSYADTIKKPKLNLEMANKKAKESDRFHDPSPQNHLLQKQKTNMFEK
jgi:hypothetical protein